MPSLPFDGQTAWGDILNTYLTALSSQASTTQTSLQNHAANSPADPHGDRAFAQTLVAPFTTGLNSANGLVRLNGTGTIPQNLIIASSAIGGMYNAVVDAVTMFGAVPNNGVDQSAALQTAMNFVSNLGGGVVYIGPGTFSVANPVIIGSNTWVHMSEGTVIQRIPGSPNAPYIFSNIQFVSTSSPATNVRVSGGKLNAVGSFNLTSACTLLELFQGSGHLVEDVTFFAPAGNSHAVEFNGCTNVTISDCIFDGTQTTTETDNSAVLINSSTTSTTPTGLNSALYNNQGCKVVSINNCQTAIPSGSNNAAYGCLAGSEIANSGNITSFGVSITNCSFAVPAPAGAVATGGATWNSRIMTGNSWGDGTGTSLSAAGIINTPWDVWTECSLGSGFSNTSGGYPLQYKVTQDGDLRLVGTVNIPNSGSTNTITTLAYHPSHTITCPVGSANSTQAVYVTIANTGRVSLTNAPTGVGGGSVFINATFPVEFAGDGMFT